jgi:hypothetical protein
VSGPSFTFDSTEHAGLSNCRIGLGSSASAAAIVVSTTTADARWNYFENLEIAAGSGVSGQRGIAMYATGGRIVAENHVNRVTTFQIDRPFIFHDIEGNFLTGLTADQFAFSTGRAAFDCIGLANHLQGRVASTSPTSGSVGLRELGARNIIDMVVDIGASSTAIDMSGSGGGNVVRLSRPELLTPVGSFSAQNTVIDTEFLSARRHLARGTLPTSAAFALDGFGSTAAVTTISGCDGRLKFTVVSAGTGQAANPTITYTFVDGAWPYTPIAQVTRDGGNQNDIPTFSTEASTTLFSTRFQGTPVAGESYVFIATVG